MPARALRLLWMSLARHGLLTLIVSELALLGGSYLYFTTMHALERFDVGSCASLTLDSSGACVSSLQALLNDNHLYPAVPVNGNFDWNTMESVIVFQSEHGLTADGIVGNDTASAINTFTPQPSILGYLQAFTNSELILPAKLCVAALVIIVAFICLLLRAALTGSARMLRIRCCLTGLFAALFAADSAAMASLLTEGLSPAFRNGLLAGQ